MAVSHMTPDNGKSVYSGNTLVKFGNGTLLPIMHIGQYHLPTQTHPLRLSSVLHVPKLQHNLLSARQLYWDNNCSIVFYSSSVRVKDNIVGDVLLQAVRSGPVYTVLPLPKSVPANVALTESADIWHCRLGHCGTNVQEILKKNSSV